MLPSLKLTIELVTEQSPTDPTDIRILKKFHASYQITICLRLVFNNSKINRMPTHMWKLNNSLLNDNLVREQIKTKIKDFLEFNENTDTSCPNLWDISKAVLIEKFI